MDDRQREVRRVFTKDQLEGMSIDQLIALVGQAGPDAKFHGTAVVRTKEGLIKYDAQATPGDYHESPEDLARTAEEVLS